MTDTAAPGVPLSVPLYKEIKRQLMDALTSGEWRPGQSIPSERRLSERFGISIGTLRKAIDELVAENILIRQQGRGTFVATHTRDRLLFYFFHVVPESGPKAYPEQRLTIKNPKLVTPPPEELVRIAEERERLLHFIVQRAREVEHDGVLSRHSQTQN